MSDRIQRFEPYAAPNASIAETVREIDENTSEVVALRRENMRLRREKASALQAAEAERVESARLRALQLVQRLEGQR